MSERVTTYKFGPYEVHTRTRELYNQGTKLKLRPQAFQVLQVLIEHAGDVVTREELRQMLWPGWNLRVSSQCSNDMPRCGWRSCRRCCHRSITRARPSTRRDNCVPEQLES